MKRHPHPRIGPVFFFIPLMLAMLACAGQALTPTLLSATQPGSPPSSQTRTGAQTTRAAWTATPVWGVTASPTPSLQGKIGDRVTSAGAGITVVGVTRTALIGLFTAGQGNVFLDVEVLIENASRTDKIPYNPYYFKVSDNHGNAYPLALTSLEPSLKTGSLAKGERVRGHIAFEVNASASPLLLSFEPNVYLAGYQVVRFNLSQKSAQPAALPTLLPAVMSGKPGERVASGGIALTVVKLASLAAIGVYQPGDGRVFLDVEVVLENTSATDHLSCNPLYFKVKDADGYEYTSALVSLDPSLKSEDLAPGEKAHGHVAFEVRKDAKGSMLSYEPVLLFKDAEEISVALGQ